MKVMAGDVHLEGEDFFYQVADFCMQDFIREVKARARGMHLGDDDFIDPVADFCMQDVIREVISHGG